MQLDSIDEETIGNYLTTAGIPDPDLLIRTGGDYRISNYLLWQIAYAELYFTDKFWPDFSKEDFAMPSSSISRENAGLVKQVNRSKKIIEDITLHKYDEI